MTRHNGNESSTPPRPLGKAGKDLWDRISTDYVLEDETDRETLCIVAETADHAADLCAAIKSDGPISETDKGARAHPAFIVVRQYRAFIVKNLAILKSHHNKSMKVLGRPAHTATGYNPDEMEETAWR